MSQDKVLVDRVQLLQLLSRVESMLQEVKDLRESVKKRE